MTTILLAVGVFTGLIVLLSSLILLARAGLVETGVVRMLVNDDKEFQVPAGGKLLTALSNVGLYLPGGCGGKGTCGQCRVKVLEGGGAMLPTEFDLIGRKEAANHVRLGCQVTVREDIRVRIPEEVFGVRKWECTVRSTRGLSTFIKEIVLELPPGEHVPFRAGGYIQIECPPYDARFSDFAIEPQFREDWERHDLWRLRAGTETATTRAYSMANYPEEEGIILLNIGIAVPPPGAKDDVRLFLWEKYADSPHNKRGTILFVHGSSMASQPTFDLQVPGRPFSSAMDWFAARGFDTWCVDMEGYGRSDKDRDITCDIANGADDLAAASAYIQSLRKNDGFLVYGISSGALRAAMFAEAHPERISRLALDAFVWTGEGSPTLEQRRKKLPQFLDSKRRPIDRGRSSASAAGPKECWLRSGANRN